MSKNIQQRINEASAAAIARIAVVPELCAEVAADFRTRSEYPTVLVAGHRSDETIEAYMQFSEAITARAVEIAKS